LAVEVDQEAPDFTLEETGQRGRHPVVVPREEERRGDVLPAGVQRGVDSRFAQGAFARSLGLDATALLADFEPKGHVARRYGAYLDERDTRRAHPS
jgi:peroxiredoxin